MLLGNDRCNQDLFKTHSVRSSVFEIYETEIPFNGSFHSTSPNQPEENCLFLTDVELRALRFHFEPPGTYLLPTVPTGPVRHHDSVYSIPLLY